MPNFVDGKDWDKRYPAAPGATEGFRAPTWWTGESRAPVSESEFEGNARGWARAWADAHLSGALGEADLLPDDIRNDLKTREPLDVIRYAVESGRADDIPAIRDIAGRMARVHGNLPEQGILAGMGQYIADNPDEMAYLLIGGGYGATKFAGSAALRAAGAKGIAGRGAKIAGWEALLEAPLALDRAGEKERVRIIAGQDPDEVRMNVALEAAGEVAIAGAFGGGLQMLGDGLVQAFRAADLTANQRAAVFAVAVRQGEDGLESEKLLRSGVSKFVGAAVKKSGARDGKALVPVSPEEAAKLEEMGFSVAGKGKKRALDLDDDGFAALSVLMRQADLEGAERVSGRGGGLFGADYSPPPRASVHFSRHAEDPEAVIQQTREDLQNVSAPRIDEMAGKADDLRELAEATKDEAKRAELVAQVKDLDARVRAGREVVRLRENGENADAVIEAAAALEGAKVRSAMWKSLRENHLDAAPAEAEIAKMKAGEAADEAVIKDFLAEYGRLTGDFTRLAEFEVFKNSSVRDITGKAQRRQDFTLADLPEKFAEFRQNGIRAAERGENAAVEGLENALKGRTAASPPGTDPAPAPPPPRTGERRTAPLIAEDVAKVAEVRELGRAAGLDPEGVVALWREVGDKVSRDELLRVARWRERYYRRVREVSRGSDRTDDFIVSRHSIKGVDMVDDILIRRLRAKSEADDEFIDGLIQEFLPLVKTTMDDGEVVWKIRVRYPDGTPDGTNKLIPLGADEGDLTKPFAEREKLGGMEGFEDAGPGTAQTARTKSRGKIWHGKYRKAGLKSLERLLARAAGVNEAEAQMMIALRRLITSLDDEPILREWAMDLGAKAADLGKLRENVKGRVSRTALEVDGEPVYLYQKEGKDGLYWEASHKEKPIVAGDNLADLRVRVMGWFEENPPDLRDDGGISPPLAQEAVVIPPKLPFRGASIAFLKQPTAPIMGDGAAVFKLDGQTAYNTTGGLWLDSGQGQMFFREGSERVASRWAFEEAAPLPDYRRIPRMTPEETIAKSVEMDAISAGARASGVSDDEFVAGMDWWEMSGAEWRSRAKDLCDLGGGGV